MDNRFWEPGDHVVVRSLQGDEIIRAMPEIVVEDTSAKTVLFTPVGNRYIHKHRKRVKGEIVYGQMGPLREQAVLLDQHTNDILMLFYPEKHFSIWLMWRHESGDFSFWYVDLQAPFRRTEIGFDVEDHDLDIVVQPDFSWCWKDEEVVRDLVIHGCWSQEKADLVRRDGLEVVEMIESKTAPFNERWEQWRPDPSWGMPVLSSQWADQPVKSVEIY